MASHFTVLPRRNRTIAGIALAAACLATVACGLAASTAPATTPSPAGLDRASLEPLLADLPAASRNAILDDISGFEAALRAVLAADSDLLVLVDKTVSLPAAYEPADLIVLDTVKPVLPVTKKGMQIRARVLPHLQALLEASRQAGVKLTLLSTYRSYQYQIGTFDREVKASGRAEAERVVALPGHSQHQLGLAIDFNALDNSLADTKAGKWLFAHAAEFGFSLSYPKGKEPETGYAWESWHYRYIGVPAVKLQLGWFADSQQLMLAFLDRHGPVLRARLDLNAATGGSPVQPRPVPAAQG
jgi:D-alanyl-D-alanine carboxypeptidase